VEPRSTGIVMSMERCLSRTDPTHVGQPLNDHSSCGDRGVGHRRFLQPLYDCVKDKPKRIIKQCTYEHSAMIPFHQPKIPVLRGDLDEFN
jgi:hypothetical protein